MVTVAKRPRRSRDRVQAHYTRCDMILGYMVHCLEPSFGEKVLEPCAGNGALIDGLLSECHNIEVLANEIDPRPLEELSRKYSDNPNIKVTSTDVVDALTKGQTLRDALGQFDKVLANPPYGAWLTEDTRQRLKVLHPALYAKETYGLFVYACMRSLNEGGRAVFILPDTFLWLNRHTHLREFLFDVNSVREIALFPSKYFPSIAFGYSGMCIITVEKSHDHTPTAVHYQFKGKCAFDGLTRARRSDLCMSGTVDLYSTDVPKILGNFIHEASAPLTSQGAWKELGELADVKTGFYSGNDRHWLRKESESVPRSKGFKQVPSKLINSDPPSWAVLGVPDDTPHYLPILKGGAAVLHKPIRWYVDWSESAVDSYRKKGRSNPARFQNSQYYFRRGIGVPMVSSSRLSAFLIDGVLFDQGVVGIFPTEESNLFFLLGYLNTSFATEAMKSINPTANNSANYLKKVKVREVPGPEQRQLISKKVEQLLQKAQMGLLSADVCRKEIDQIYRPVFGV